MMSTDALLSKTTGKLWSEIEVSDDEFQVEPETVRGEALRPQPCSTDSYSRSMRATAAAMDAYSNDRQSPSSSRHHHGRRGAGGNRRMNGSSSYRGGASRGHAAVFQATPPPSSKPATANPDAPRKRRFAGISSLEVLLDWPRQTSSLAAAQQQQKEAAAPLSSTESSTSIPSSSIIEEDPSTCSNDSAPEDSTPTSQNSSVIPAPTICLPSEPPTAATIPSPEPADPPFPKHNKATDDSRSRSPATFEGRMRGWPTESEPESPTSEPESAAPSSNPPPPTTSSIDAVSEPPSDTECASQISETARPLEGHMTEEDGDVIFHERFEIWYTLPSGGARKGINKEVYEGGMHKIGIFTRVSEFFEFHRMLDWNTLPPNSVIAFCREGIRPIWEDSANETGGRFLVKNFARDDTEAIFTKTALGFFSGLFRDWKNYNLVSLHIRDVRRGNDIQLWRRTIQSAISPGDVKEDILSITSEERPANLMVSFVPNRESLSRNGERLANHSCNRKSRSGGRSGNGRRSPGGSATIESVFGSSAAARSVSSLYSKGKVFSLSAEEKERMIEDCAQEAARINAKLCEQLPAQAASTSSPPSDNEPQRKPTTASAEESAGPQHYESVTAQSSPRSARSELTREAMGEALNSGSAGGNLSPRGGASMRRREPIPDMLHPAQLMVNPMMGCYYVPAPPAPAPSVVCLVTGVGVPEEELEKLTEEETAMGSGNYVAGIPMYWHPAQPAAAPMCVMDPHYAAYYSMPGSYAGWGMPSMCYAASPSPNTAASH